MNNLWVQTDDATGQHVQAIAGESGAYRFIDTIGLGKSQYAVITDEDFAVARVVRAVKEGAIESASGKLITVKPDTICIHGDNVHALEFAGKIRTALTEAGVEVKPV